MTVPDIIQKVFDDEALADFKLELTGKYPKWTYCVQYREALAASWVDRRRGNAASMS
jgi:uncharacterized protein involved in type VI secretion and phage assembly